MNGIDTLKEIMRRHPLPVIVVSSHSTEGASITLKALGLGAFDFVAKPQDAPAHMAGDRAELIAKIKAAAESKVSSSRELSAAVPRGKACGKANLAHARPTKLVAIGISTGGPQALRISVVAIAARIFPERSGGAAHAGRIHRNVCPPAGRTLRPAGQRSAIRRLAAGRPRAHLPRKPAHGSSVCPG